MFLEELVSLQKIQDFLCTSCLFALYPKILVFHAKFSEMLLSSPDCNHHEGGTGI